jgi:hypothetical protein
MRVLNNPIIWALFSVLIGVGVAVSLKLWAGEQLIPIIGGLISTVLSLELGQLFRSYQLTPKLTVLEKSLADSHLYDSFARIISSREALENHLRVYPLCKQFFQERLDSTYARSVAEWQELANGLIVVDDPQRELTWTSDILCIAKTSIRAVSFGDEDYWPRPEGQAYLREQAVLIKRGITIHRVFIVERAKIDSQLDIICRQANEFGIHTYVVYADRLRAEECEDFVIYDDYAVRYARRADNAGTLKVATLSIVPEEARRYINKYNSLQRRSVIDSEQKDQFLEFCAPDRQNQLPDPTTT